MRYIGNLLITIIMLAMSPAFGESYDELVERNGLFYKKFSTEPFSGKVDWKIETYLCNSTLKNGVLEGAYSCFFDNGQLRAEGFYNNGKRHGRFASYYHDGQLEEEIEYKNNLQHGNYLKYFENGEIHLEGKYMNSKKEGLFFEYYENGQLKSKGSYVDGQKDGIWVGYDKSGLIEKTKTGSYNKGTFYVNPEN